MDVGAAIEATVRLRVASFRRSQRCLIGREVSQIEAMRSIWQVRACALVHLVVAVALGLGVDVVVHCRLLSPVDVDLCPGRSRFGENDSAQNENPLNYGHPVRELPFLRIGLLGAIDAPIFRGAGGNRRPLFIL